ncbi:MAG: ACP S-malonyltransferase [Oscillospiraceae bacterium]
MKKSAFIFSGQGSTYQGMGKDFYENFKSVRYLYDEASDIFDFDLAKISFDGDAQTLAKTEIAQPLIYTLSMGIYNIFKEYAVPYAIAGHSLGEYAALTVAGAFTVEQGFTLIKARANAMKQASEKGKGVMYAIMGSDEKTIQSICENIEGYVLPVNYNSHAQTVIAGEEEACNQAVQCLSEQGAKAIKLPVSSAFHTNFMEQAGVDLKTVASTMNLKPNVPNFYSNLTGTKLEIIEDVPDYMCKHMVSPVLFTSQLMAMQQDGIENFIEMGCGKTLTGLVKKTLKGIGYQSIEDVKTLEKAKELVLPNE